MRPSSRPLFSWAFTAFFGCISLAGQALHSFVGHSFHRGPGESEHDCHAAAEGQLWAGHDDFAEHDFAKHDAFAVHEGDGEACGMHGRASATGHDCPICSHFSQAQSNFYLAPPSVAHISAAAVVAATAQCVAGATSDYRSRAPPAA
jgi:hypothetical protein